MIKKSGVIFSWFLALCVSVFYLSFYSTHANVIWYEQSATLYDLWAAQFGISHIAFYALPRPGFLLDTLLVILGVAPESLRTLTMFLTLLTSGILAFSLFKFILPKDSPRTYFFSFIFPWIVLLGIPSFNRPLDYESAPVIFICLSMVFFIHRNYFWPVFSALFLSYATFSSLSALPAGLLVSMGMIFIFKDKEAKKIGYLSLIFILIFYGVYYGVEGVAWRVYNGISHVNNTGLSQHIPVFIIYGLELVLGLVLGLIFCYLLKDLKLYTCHLFLELSLVILLGMIVFVSLFGGLGMIIDSLEILFFCLIISILFKLLDLSYESKKTLGFALISGYLFLVFQHMFSGSYLIFVNYYSPFLLVVIGVLLGALGRGGVFYRFNRMLCFCFLMILALLHWNFFMSLNASNFQVIGPAWQNFSKNTEPSFIGVNVNKNLNYVYTNIQDAYDESDCKEKPVLVIAYPGLYFMFKRLAPFDQIWLSREVVIPDNSKITDEVLIQWLASQKSWCVFDANTQPERVRKIRQNFLFPTRNYLARQSDTKQDLGYAWIESSHFVLWVKE